VRVHADRRFLPAGAPYVPMLFPHWGHLVEDPEGPTAPTFDEWAAEGAGVVGFERDPAAADVVVLPANWRHYRADPAARRLAEECHALAAEAGKQLLVFYWDDDDGPLPFDDALVLRTSLTRSGRRPGEFAMPSWNEDFVEQYLGGEVVIRPWTDRPKVSFRGLAAPMHVPVADRARDLKKQAGRAVRGKPRNPNGPNPGMVVRTKALRRLARDRRLDLEYEVFAEFYAGSVHGGSPQQRRDVRKDYVASMVDSDYVLCARGAGNFSYRFYETLSCGRIPLFVDTDCVLPFDFAPEVDWRRHCVWVDAGDLRSIGSRLVEFHRRLTADGFVELQRANRALWEEWISPLGFFRHVDRHLEVAPRLAPT
jgi:hypothetical protein